MATHILESISWHDLPVESVAISKSGVQLAVSQFQESTGEYLSLVLSLFQLDGLDLEMSGQLSISDLSNLEVASFQFSHIEPGYISGCICLLPGSAGYWRIAFSKAQWQLLAPNNSLKRDPVSGSACLRAP